MNFARSFLGGLACIAALLSTPAAHAASTLYAIASDGNGVGRVLAPIAPAGGGVAVGNGSVALNGGLAATDTPNRWLAIANDAAGRSSLVAFDAAAPGSFLSTTALGSGFTGGLAASGGTHYAVATDATGLSSLYTVGVGSGASLVGTLGFGFADLAFDALDGRLYALAADASGTPRVLERITLGGSGIGTTALFSLGGVGTGFLGGMAWDADASRFAVVGSDSTGASTLYRFDLSGAASLTAVRSLGAGYLNGGLAFATPVPEPATGGLLAAGALALAFMTRRPRSTGA